MAIASETARNATINLRLQATTRDLIDQAAAAAGKTRTEFIVEAARREAELILLDRCLFSLDKKEFAAFTAALDRAPAANPQLRELLRTSAPWE